MALNAVRARPGPVAVHWLLGRVREIQAGDALRPVTVIVPNHYVGLALQRRLAGPGYANVRFTRLPGLAEPFGAPMLAARGLTPLTDIEEEAAIREALRLHGQGFGEVRQHRAVVEMLKQLFGEIREREIGVDQLATWSRTSRIAEAAFTTFAGYRRLLDRNALYDQTDLMRAAVAGLAGPARRRLREIGNVVLFLPERWRPLTVSLIRALADISPVDIALPALEDDLADEQAKDAATVLGFDWSTLPEAGPSIEPADVTIVLAPDPSGEIRVAVRQIAADLEAGIPLYGMAILYRREEPYAAMVRETLDAAGLPWAALEGRPLVESIVGRGLLGLLRLRDLDFSRRAVLDWRSSLPHAGRDMPSFSEWNRISRKAGVVRGTDGWKRGLDRFIRAIEERLDEKDASRSEAQLKYLERERERAEQIEREVARIASDTEPPADATWGALAAWAARCRGAHVPAPGSDIEREAGEAVDEVVQKLRIAQKLEERTDVTTFIDTLEAALTAARRPEGRLGVGVSVGSATTAVGLQFDRVHLVGLSEGVFPVPEPADPIFPDGDQLGRRVERLGEERRAFLAAFAAADDGRVRLSAPSWDTSLRRAFAAPWLLEISSGLGGRPLTSSELWGLTGPSWLTRVMSPSQSLDIAPALLDIGEWRTEQARASQGLGRLERSGLARRTDLPLGRNLEVQRSRRSTSLTSFDGHVRARADAGLARHPTSASAIEDWAECPFRYFMGRVLRVEATENPEDDEKLSIGALLKGSLIHRILERFFRELRVEGRPRLDEGYGTRDHDLLESIAFKTFADVEAGGQAGHALSWANERDAILLDLHSTLTDDETRRERFVPAKFEQAFGMDTPDSWQAAAIPLSAGGEARIRGYIDRLDLPPEGMPPDAALVLDYKSGWIPNQKHLKADPVLAGTQMQLAAYSVATRRWLAEEKGAGDPAVEAAYWGITAKWKFARVSVTLDADVERRLREVVDIIDRGLRNGAFPQVPGDETQRDTRASWTNCLWCPYTRICPSGRDQLWRSKREDRASALHGTLALDAEPPK